MENLNKQEIVTRVITFFFPYDSKLEENTQWHSEDPRDFGDGHPHGHETWGHGVIGNIDWESSEEWEETTTISPTLSANNPYPGSSTTAPLTSIQPSDAQFAVILALYFLILVAAFVSNILVANVIKKYRWGMKMALLFHLCITGALSCLTNTLHFAASAYHLIKRNRSTSSSTLQFFAIFAWMNHLIGYALLIFIMYLSIFCFKFYWNNKTRSVEWGRSYVILAVVSSWVLAFLLAFFTAYFQCDAHVGNDQCIRILCATSNIFSAIFTELLTRVRIVIPVIIILIILLSVRVGSSKQRNESMVKTEGADVYGDREILMICSSIFMIYEACNIIPQLFLFFCISPLVSVCAHHFALLISTFATPIAVIGISRNTRERMRILYSCTIRGKAVPQGSYAHVAKKYKDSDENAKRRPSGITLFTPETSSSSDEHTKNHPKLSIINEEAVDSFAKLSTSVPAKRFIKNQDTISIVTLEDDHDYGHGHMNQNHNQNQEHQISHVDDETRASRQNSAGALNISRRVSLHSESAPIDFHRRRVSSFDMPQVGDTSASTQRLKTLVENRTEKFGLKNHNIVNFHLPQNIFIHHTHENRIKPVEVMVKPAEPEKY